VTVSLPKLTPFGELFEQATRKGIDKWGLADRLLRELKAGLTAYGYRRQFSFPDGFDRKERLPRDTHRQPIPNYCWLAFDSVSGALDCQWVDDPDDPVESGKVDWISGQLETFETEWENAETILHQFHNIGLPKAKADALISELAGEPKKGRGRPPGASDAWEREQAEKGFRMLRDGDTRTIPAIAANLANGKLEPDQFEKQKRRIADNIVALRKAAEKSPRK